MAQMAKMAFEGGNNSPPLNEPITVKKKEIRRISANKRWCFTWHDYPENYLDILATMANDLVGFIYGQEICKTTKRPHIQGYVEFKRAMRPFEFKALPKKTEDGVKPINWEKCKGTRADNLTYCSKDGKYVTSPNFRVPRTVTTLEVLRPWQQALDDMLQEEPNDRTIHWYWERMGNVGKSAYTRYCCIKYNAVICSGRAADMKNLIVNHEKATGVFPDVVIFDVPRSSMNYLSYTGIEEIKNGTFASSKYESTMVIMPFPHVVVFANEEPTYEQLSSDRWHVVNIDNE